jgi:hypothetical protein
MRKCLHDIPRLSFEAEADNFLYSHSLNFPPCTRSLQPNARRAFSLLPEPRERLLSRELQIQTRSEPIPFSNHWLLSPTMLLSDEQREKEAVERERHHFVRVEFGMLLLLLLRPGKSFESQSMGRTRIPGLG